MALGQAVQAGLDPRDRGVANAGIAQHQAGATTLGLPVDAQIEFGQTIVLEPEPAPAQRGLDRRPLERAADLAGALQGPR
jgi:hypothetical protein